MNSKLSKSARKRETTALQALGERLIELTADQLDVMDLDNSLRDAIVAARGMRAHGALRRQKQLIGKLMRNVDPEPISIALDRFNNSARQEKEVFRQAEAWRDRLTAGGQKTLADFYASTGQCSEALGAALREWSAAPNDKIRRLAGRKIFREVHKELQSKMQS